MDINGYSIETDSQALCMVMRYSCLTGLDPEFAIEMLLILAAKTERKNERETDRRRY